MRPWLTLILVPHERIVRHTRPSPLIPLAKEQLLSNLSTLKYLYFVLTGLGLQDPQQGSLVQWMPSQPSIFMSVRQGSRVGTDENMVSCGDTT